MKIMFLLANAKLFGADEKLNAYDNFNVMLMM